MPLFQEKAAALKQLSTAFCMWRRRRPPPLLCGSTPQIFSRASSMITHLEFNRIDRRYRSHFSFEDAAAARALIEDKPTTAGASSEVHKFKLVRPHVVEILMGMVRKLNLELDAGERRRATATCGAIVHVLCGSPGVEKKTIPLFSEIMSSDHDLATLVSLSSEGRNHGGDHVVVIGAVFDAVIRGYGRLKILDRAAHTFFLACARGYVPCIDTCNFLMELFLDDFEQVEYVYGQIKRSQAVRPNLHTLRVLMRTFLDHALLDKSFGVFDEMLLQGIVPDSSLLSEFVYGLCDWGGPAYAYLVIMKSARIFGISLTTADYNHVISGFCENEMGKMYEAEEVLEEMVKQGVPPDVKTYASLIGGYCCASGNNNISRVLSLLDQMDMRGIKTNCDIRGSILHCFSELGKNAQVLEFFKNYKNSGEIGEILDKVLYNIAIDAQCKLGKMEEAFEVFQEMKGCGLVPDKIHYKALINGYCRQGEIDKAWKTFSCMTDVGLKPDVASYKILVSAFADSGFVEETLDVLYHMLHHGVNPFYVTNAGHDKVVEGFCRGLSKPKISRV